MGGDQIGLGLAIPFLLFPHIINTRFAHVFFGVNDTYLYELKRLWPDNAPLQSLLLLIVWTDGCMGLHYWLRLSEGYRQIAPWLLGAAVAVPLLALAGFMVGGRATGDIMSDPAAFFALKERSHWPSDTDGATLATWRDLARIAFGALLAAIAGTHVLRYLSRLIRRDVPGITYAGGPTIALTPGSAPRSKRAARPESATPPCAAARKLAVSDRGALDERLAWLEPAAMYHLDIA